MIKKKKSSFFHLAKMIVQIFFSYNLKNTVHTNFIPYRTVQKKSGTVHCVRYRTSWPPWTCWPTWWTSTMRSRASTSKSWSIFFFVMWYIISTYFLKNTVHSKIPYTPTLYRTVPYKKNPVPYIVYGTVHRGHPAYRIGRVQWCGYGPFSPGGSGFVKNADPEFVKIKK